MSWKGNWKVWDDAQTEPFLHEISHVLELTDDPTSQLMALLNSSRSKSRILSLKLEASAGLNHFEWNCKMKSTEEFKENTTENGNYT